MPLMIPLALVTLYWIVHIPFGPMYLLGIILYFSMVEDLAPEKNLSFPAVSDLKPGLVGRLSFCSIPGMIV